MDLLNPPRSGPLRRALLALLLAAYACTAASAPEHELRVAMIYNIARFVQWPRAALNAAHFTICTVGGGEVIDALPTLRDKPLSDLPVAVLAVQRGADLANCQLIYIAPDNAMRLGAISELLKASNTVALTVSDAPSFLALGGMVQLVVVDGRQRFRINQALAERNGLVMNAKLMQLALPAGDQ